MGQAQQAVTGPATTCLTLQRTQASGTIYDTQVAQLKRFKDDAREVAEGFECGILLENFNDEKEGDILEVYETREVERTSLDEAAPAAAAASTDS